MSDLNRSKFDLSHELKTSFEMGQLVPFYFQDVVPGDVFRVNTRSFVRLQPMVAPPMHKIDMYMRYYYVPYRLLQENYREMLTDPESPVVVDNVAAFYPGVKSINLQGTLFRQFGINSVNGKLDSNALARLSAYPFLAYYLIYNYYYLDPILDSTLYIDNFQPRDFKRNDSVRSQLFRVQEVNWFDDYFTSARPTTQYGSEVELDMDGNSVIKVSEMRLAEKLQWYKEKLLSTGNRYADYIKAFFGVHVRDRSLQRPLYLGGSSQTLNISDIDQTTPSVNDPLGNIGGKSATVVNGVGYNFDVDEHGIILGLCFVKPRQAYISGIPRSFLARDFYDFFNPAWANIGMQELYGCELDANRTDVFGYSDRYAHLKYGSDIIAGDFAEELSFWHFGRDIRSEKLSSSFLRCRPNLDPFAVVGDDFADIKVYTFLEWKEDRGALDAVPDPSGVWQGVYPYTGKQFFILAPDKLTSYLRGSDLGDWDWQVSDFTGFYAYNNPGGVAETYKNLELHLVSGLFISPNRQYDFPYDRTSGMLKGIGLTRSDLSRVLSRRVITNADAPTVSSGDSAYKLINFLKEIGSTNDFKMFYIRANEFSWFDSKVSALSTSDLGITKDSLSKTVQFGDLFDEYKSVNDHVLAVFFNDVDALRPLPKSYSGTIM